MQGKHNIYARVQVPSLARTPATAVRIMLPRQPTALLVATVVDAVAGFISTNRVFVAAIVAALPRPHIITPIRLIANELPPSSTTSVPPAMMVAKPITTSNFLFMRPIAGDSASAINALASSGAEKNRTIRLEFTVGNHACTLASRELAMYIWYENKVAT